VQSRLQDFDPKSELHGLRHQNRLYRVTSQGAHPA